MRFSVDVHAESLSAKAMTFPPGEFHGVFTSVVVESGGNSVTFFLHGEDSQERGQAIADAINEHGKPKAPDAGEVC